MLNRPDIPALPDDPQATDPDREFIGRAYQIAKQAISRGNRPFGSLLVHKGKIIAEYENTVEFSGDVTQHAETGLVALASRKFPRDILSHSILYTSTEPCIMCCGAIYWAGISKVVYGTTGSQMSRLLKRDYVSIPAREIFQRVSPHVIVTGPILEEEGLQIHTDWHSSQETPSRS